MSLNPVPICASCGKPSKVAISCTKCLQISCTACFNGLVNATVKANVDLALLVARICRNCKNAGQVVVATGNETSVGCHTNQELCLLHGKARNLYCENCSVAICGSCIDVGEAHDIHRVNNLATVCLDKISRVGSRLIRAEEKNDELLASSLLYGRNLELLEKEEESVLEEIETIAERSKLKVFRITAARKELLKKKCNGLLSNGVILEEVRSELKQLSPYELLEQLPKIEQKCEEMICQESEISLPKVDDIHCDLIPQYRFTDIVFRKFLTAAKHSVGVFSIKVAHDVEWKLTVTKDDMLQIEINVGDDRVLQELRLMLVVIIPHSDYQKAVHLSFEIKGGKKIDVVHSSHLVEQGFCSERTGKLKMKIGIRCCNALVERQLVNYLYNRVKAELSNQLSVNEKLSLAKNCYYNHFMEDVILKVSEVQNGVISSGEIRDDQDRLWVLKSDVAYDMLALYVHLMSGTDTYSNYFIELMHTNPLKTIFTSARMDFVAGGTGWGYMFEHLDKLTNDVGFSPDGCLHIRFGVLPTPSSAEPPAPSAANA